MSIISNDHFIATEDTSGGLNAIGNYLSDLIEAKKRLSGLSQEEAKTLTVSHFKQTIKDPKVKYYLKADNKDKDIAYTTLSKYIASAIKLDDIITPTFTRMINPKIELSMHTASILDKLEKRKHDKRLAASYYSKEDFVKASFYSVLQKSRKIFNNAFSGGYISKGTTLHNASGHSVLTSMTRGVASIGNSISESMLGGNRMYATPEDVYNHLILFMNRTNHKVVKKAVKAFNLHIPTVNEVISTIKWSSELYWKSNDEMDKFKLIIEKMTKYERVAFVYTNDLFQLRVYNKEFIRHTLKKLSSKATTARVASKDTILKSEYDVQMAMRHICADDIVGQDVNYDNLEGTQQLDVMSGTVENIETTLTRIDPLIQAFFLTDLLPPNIVDIKRMNRRSIVLSDTDSTCASNSDWVSWVYGENRFDDIAAGLSASILILVSGTIRHSLSIFSTNMNVPKKFRSLLAMKNEYYWSTFVPANISKHYFSDTWIVEGQVLKKRKLEVKGKNFVSATIPNKYRKMLHDAMIKISDDVSKYGHISIVEYLEMVIGIEREIMSEIESGDYSNLLIDNIKEAKSYGSSPDKSPYRYLEFWNATFGKKYGMADEAPSPFIKVKVTLDSKRKLKEYIDALEDQELAYYLREHFKNNPANSGLSTIRIPKNVIEKTGIPKEIVSVFDKAVTISKITLPFYLKLQTLGYFRKPNELLIDTI